MITLLLLSLSPRVLPIPGKDLQNVYQLRTPEDANKIAEQAAGKNVVIIGSSFIGLLFLFRIIPKLKSNMIITCQ